MKCNVNANTQVYTHIDTQTCQSASYIVDDVIWDKGVASGSGSLGVIDLFSSDSAGLRAVGPFVIDDSRTTMTVSHMELRRERGEGPWGKWCSGF